MDIVIPFHIKDIDILPYCVLGTNNIIHKRNVYIISNEDPHIENTIFIHENTFPFTKIDIIAIWGDIISNRVGWYYQQLLKLYAYKVIPELSDKFLILDSDTIFINPIELISINIPLYGYGREYHIPYFTHIKKIIPELTKQIEDKSGICHHMIFDKKILDELFYIVEEKHNNIFWKILIINLDKDHLIFSGMSEYELYFNYMLQNHPDKILLHNIHWTNSRDIPNNTSMTTIELIEHVKPYFHYISVHTYIS